LNNTTYSSPTSNHRFAPSSLPSHPNREISSSTHCGCRDREDIDDAGDKVNSDNLLSASHEEVVVGLEELLVEITIEIGEYRERFGV